MNREIKFRAWSNKWNKMVFHNKDGYSIDVLNNTVCLDFVLDELPVLMQYTGLKDKNGVEIYEGDIIYDGNNKYLVEYKDGCFVAIKISNNKELYCVYHLFNCEIIGNIYENPELLK